MFVCYDVDCTNNFIISLMFNILFFLPGGQPIFENEGICKKLRIDLYKETRKLWKLENYVIYETRVL